MDKVRRVLGRRNSVALARRRPKLMCSYDAADGLTSEATRRTRRPPSANHHHIDQPRRRRSSVVDAAAYERDAMMAYPPPVPPPGQSSDLFSPSETASLQGFLSDFAASDLTATSLPVDPITGMGYNMNGGAGTGGSGKMPVQGGARPEYASRGGPPQTPHAAGLEAFKAYSPHQTSFGPSSGIPSFHPHAHPQRSSPATPSHPHFQTQLPPQAQQLPPSTPVSRTPSQQQQQGYSAASIRSSAADREERMRQQTRELTAWMSARGINSAAGGGGPPGSEAIQGQEQGYVPGMARVPPQSRAVRHEPTASGSDSGSLSRRGSAIVPPQPQPPQPQPPAQQAQPQPQPPPAAAPQPPAAPAKAPKSKAAKGKGKAKEESNRNAGPPAKREKALLSNEQKRANHIASEQKRRAAIRQGYDRLCDVVPSLRPSASHTNLSNLSAAGGGTEGSDSEDPSGVRKKRKKREDAAGAGGDGRTGPKSEATVLARTVDHLRDLDAERIELVTRLANLHALAQAKGMHVESGERTWELPWSQELMEGTEEEGTEDE